MLLTDQMTINEKRHLTTREQLMGYHNNNNKICVNLLLLMLTNQTGKVINSRVIKQIV